MTNRIFRSICLVVLAVFFASVALIMGVLYKYFSDVQRSQLKMQINLAVQGVSNEGMGYFDGLDTQNYRITWIGADGEVLFDNQTGDQKMENHLEREEIKEAIANGYGESERYSVTLMERSLYAAKRLDDGTILRLSVAQSTILTLMLGMVQPIAIVFLIAIILSILLAKRLSQKIVEPLNEIDLDHPLREEAYEELSPFLRRIDSQKKELKGQSRELQRKEDELDAIISNMKEGMILLNSKGKIISINPSAMRLLDTNGYCIGRDVLTICRNLDMQEVLTSALEGEQAEKTVELNGGYYQIDASPIISNETVSGVALLLFDVTEKENAEQMRREFTGNVSHELKTPLHSISGYAELLKNGLVKEEDVGLFSERIYSEAQRMIALVEDIINLSHLDEGADDMRREEVDLYGLAENTIQSLQQKADGKQVRMTLEGEHALLKGVPQLLEGILFNLCDNAIKYNRENGSVKVFIKDCKDEVVLTVSDTGIGIPEEHQERIFERFYRVDKSHSKEVGGTGLGLSIVKHAVRLHGAAIRLSSAVGQGTSISIAFPK